MQPCCNSKTKSGHKRDNVTMRYFLLLLLFALPAAAQKSVAITLDDLPVSTYSQNPSPDAIRVQQEITRNILATLTRHHVPATGFVNEIKLNTPGARDAYAAMLQSWLDAGMDLGCHGYAHLALSATPLDAYEADFYRGTVITPLLMKQAGKHEHYFRYPYNDTGDTREKKDSFQAFLKDRQYDIAPVTLQNDDWMYSKLYDGAIAQEDAVAAERLLDAYLDENQRKLVFIEQLSQSEFGRNIPQVLDIHVNSMNAAALDALLTQFERNGYKFVSLDAALADPAYKTPDMYVGNGGISWMQRWLPALGKPIDDLGDPGAPDWVVKAYKELSAK
jgi:peptidoglycan/xylan/chitin deacetylase (PgdA/CDA1 family)